MFSQPENTPVWVDERRCKACNICVSVCPAGVLAMKDDKYSIKGIMIEVVYPSACIGCRSCELQCPDFAIYVADKGFKFAKISQEAKDRVVLLKDNKFKKLEACK